MTSKRKISETIPYRIAIVFLAIGIISLILSVYRESQILAFIGLGLSFGGFLFLLIRPEKYVKGSLLASIATSEYLTISKMIKSLQYEPRAYYIPHSPKEGYPTEHLKDLKEPVVFICSEKEIFFNFETSSVEIITDPKFLFTKQKGVIVIPPGLGLLTEIEKQLQLDFTRIKLDDLCKVIPQFIVEEFNLAKSMHITLSEHKVNLKMVDFLFENLYRTKNCTPSIGLLGCPVISAVACALAKSSGNFVTIQKLLLSLDASTAIVEYNLGQG